MLCRADLAAADGLLTVPFNGPRRNRDLLERSRTRVFRLFLWQSLRCGALRVRPCARREARSGPGLLPLRGGAGMLWGGEAFGVPKRGTAYQPGVKPRVCRTTGAF